MTGFCTMIVCLLATLSFTKSKENNFTDLSDVSLPTESSSINQKFHVSDASDDENRGKRTNYGEAISTSADRAIKSTPKTDSAKIALEKFESSKLPGANIHDDGRFFKENGMDSSIGKRFKMETHENKFNKLKWILTKSSSWNNSVVTELPIDFQVPSTELENNVNENPVLPKSTNGSSNVASLQKGKATNDGSTTHGNIFERVKSARSSVNGKSKFLKPDVSAEVTNLTLTSPSNDIIFRTSEVSDNAMYNQKLSSELRSTITTPKEKFQTIRDGLAASVHSGTTPHNSSTPFGPRPVKMTPSSSTPGANVDTNSGYATGSSGDLQTSPGSYKTSVSAAITSFNSGKMLHHNESANKEIPWPVKKEAIVEGDLIIGGLMMVHEREDSITCGPVMPQGGIQALEAMLFTLDQLNTSPEPLLSNITLGAHILDDCDKDTYGLEMAVDFIKGSISNIDGAEYHCNRTQVRKVISGVVGAPSSVTSIQVANLLRLFKIPQLKLGTTEAASIYLELKLLD